MNFDAKVSGISVVQDNLNKTIANMYGMNKRSITKAVMFIEAESKRLVPVDTGVLRASGRHEVVEDKGETIGKVSYTASYAVFVHERVDLRHKEGKQAKFLEDVLLKKRGEILDIFKREFQNK